MDASIDVAGAGGGVPVTLPDLTFRRLIAAERALVFRAWTSPACVAAWWGPHGYSNPFTAIEPHPGGRFHVHMQAPDGSIEPVSGHFVEIDEPRHIVFVTSLADAAGNLTRETRHTVTLAARENRTELHLHAMTTRAAPHLLPDPVGMEDGWRQSLERLGAILEAI